jgi:hypothetical protein
MRSKEIRWFYRGIRLEPLKNFLDHVVAEAINEIESIDNRRLAGEFEASEDYESVEDLPLARIEIGSRAVGQELANFLESDAPAYREAIRARN